MSVHRKIRSFILSNLVSPDNRMIGMEEECILHNMDGKRIPVNLGDELSNYNDYIPDFCHQGK